MTRATRICLIDDDALVRDALKLGLSDAGCEVFTAPGAAAGLDLVARTPVDVIVTDLNMPGTDGAQLILEARARWPDLPIVAITGADNIGGRAVADIAQELGAHAWLVKPFRTAQLLAVLDRVLAPRAGDAGL